MRLKRVFVLAAMMVATALSAAAQGLTMSVKGSPTEDASDLDARVYYSREDQNEEVCALIKVTPTNPLKNELVLEVGGLGVTDREERDNGEIWFWVPAQVKNLNFSCSGYTTPPPVPVRLKEGVVYRLTLHTDATFETVQNAVLNLAYLKINISPADAGDAFVMVGRTPECELYSDEAQGGFFSTKLEHDTYYYRIEHPLYKTLADKVTLDGSTPEINVQLQPNYSYLTITSTPSGATVMIDGRRVGTTPFVSDTKYPARDISVRVSKDNYHHRTETIRVLGSGQRQTYNYDLTPQFGQCTLRCDDPEAEIYIDNTFRGKGSWSGTLGSSSSHIVEARRAGHKSQSITISVKDGETLTKSIPAPIALYGIVEIDTTPAKCKVEIDGKEVGTTPFLQQLIVGPYKVRLSKEGYISQTHTIEVTHNGHTTLSQTLQKGKLKFNVKISCVDTQAAIFVDGNYRGQGSWSGTLDEGEHEIRSTRENHGDGVRTFVLSDSHPTNVVHTYAVPSPQQLYGSIEVTTNHEGGIWQKGANDSSYGWVGDAVYTNKKIPVGNYSYYAYKSGYETSETVSVFVGDGEHKKVKLRLKREPLWRRAINWTGDVVYSALGVFDGFANWNDDYHGFDNQLYLEPFYGFPTIDSGNSWRAGLNLGYFFRDDFGRTGLHASLSNYDGDLGIAVGPLIRLNDSYDDFEWQAYGGIGLGSTTLDGNTKWKMTGEVGIRANFSEISEYNFLSYSSFSLGAHFYDGDVYPTIGVSLWPAMIFQEDNDNYVSIIGEMLIAVGDGFQYGATAAYVPSSLGWYGTFLIADNSGGDDYYYDDYSDDVENSFTTGVVYSWLDGCLSTYGGIGVVDGSFGIDFGARLSMGYSFSLGLQTNFDRAFLTIGIGVGF